MKLRELSTPTFVALCTSLRLDATFGWGWLSGGRERCERGWERLRGRTKERRYRESSDHRVGLSYGVAWAYVCVYVHVSTPARLFPRSRDRLRGKGKVAWFTSYVTYSVPPLSWKVRVQIHMCIYIHRGGREHTIYADGDARWCCHNNVPLMPRNAP